jgi:hypothetical protein
MCAAEQYLLMCARRLRAHIEGGGRRRRLRWWRRRRGGEGCVCSSSKVDIIGAERVDLLLFQTLG